MGLLDKINEAMGKLNYAFINPPILIGGGKELSSVGGLDIDLAVTDEIAGS
jgi:hypothetical protein